MYPVHPLLALLLMVACATPPEVPAPAAPAAVDPHAAGGACEGCHAAEQRAWAGSHHAEAQREGVDARRFDGVTRRVGGLQVTPGLVDGAPAFTVEDAAGRVTLRATGTIGVAPLQQVLLDGARGRSLIAPLAYDLARAAWFDPAPDGAVGDPADPLYWAGLAGTWNHQCASCHNTGFVKNYDPSSDSYTSAAAHTGVTCAACHGAATAPLALRDASAQLQACASCHSRRRPLTCSDDPGAPFLDRYRPALLDSGAFLADGRIAAAVEPFEWAPWSQSRMAAAGVRCTDCHDAHSGGLAREGAPLCTGCHVDLTGRADHPAGDGCVGCHMPTATYMGVHARHDHGLHRPGDPRQAAAFAPALAGEAGAAPGLLAVALDGTLSAVERASALALLRRAPPPPNLELIRGLAGAPEALIRAEAVATLGAWGDPAPALQALTDPVRAVRLAALTAYVDAGGDAARAGPGFARVLLEVEQLGACEDDLPGTHQNLGRLRAATGDRAGAISAFEVLLRLDPDNATARRALDVLDPSRMMSPTR